MPKPLLKWLVGTLLSVSTNYNHYNKRIAICKQKIMYAASAAHYLSPERNKSDIIKPKNIAVVIPAAVAVRPPERAPQMP